MFGKEKKDPKAESAAKRERDIKVIEKYFPVERGVSSFLSNLDLINAVVDIATGKIPEDINRFLKLLGRSPNDPENLKKFREMTAELKG